jgi:hypothetical protein
MTLSFPRLLACLAGILVLSPSSVGSDSAARMEYYVAPIGSAQGDGSREQPWDLESALSSPLARPGTTLWLLPGVYAGSWISSLAGTAAMPVAVRAEQRGQTLLRTTTSDPALIAGGSWTVFRDLVIQDSSEAVRITGEGIRLSNSTLTGNTVGVRITAAAGLVEVSANRISGTGEQAGIQVEGGGDQLRLIAVNEISHHRSGIAVEEGQGQVILERNILHHNAAGAAELLVNRENTIVEGNYLTRQARRQTAPEAVLIQIPYQPGHAVVAVDNQAHHDRVVVELAALLRSGEGVAIRRDHDSGELLWSGVWPGGTVALPLAEDSDFALFHIERLAPSEVETLPAKPAERASGSVPVTDLRLWLDAGAGVTLNGSAVSSWADQSGMGNHASQTLAGKQPTLAAAAVNNKPAVRFDGIDDFLTFSLAPNGLTGMTIFLVSASLADLNGSWNGVTHAPLFWNETAAWGALHVSPFQRVVRYRFGTGQTNNLPAYTHPVSLGTGFSVTAVTKDGSNERLHIDGSLALSQSGKLTTIDRIRSTGNLGRGYNDNTFFNGYVSEVLVYSRALSDADRQQVEQYLKLKYLPPAVNSAPTANAGPDQTITLPAGVSLNGSVTDDGLPTNTVANTWALVTGPGAVTFGNPSVAATTATFSVAGMYTLRLTATDGALSASDEVIITVDPAPPPDTTPPIISSVQSSAITHQSATITWNTNEPTDARVNYTPSGGATQSSPLQPALTTAHTVTLNNLTPSTLYQYCVLSRDAATNLATSCGHSFSTSAAPPVPVDQLKLWLKADSGITLQGGTSISQWADLSPTATHATQPLTASQPQLVAGAINGNPAVRFDGVNDFLTFQMPVDGYTGFTILLVSANEVAQDGTWHGAANAPLFWNETGVWGAVHLSPFQNVIKYRFGTGQSGNLPLYFRPSSVGSTFTLTTAVKDGATETLFVNGTQVLSQGGKLPTLQRNRATGNLGRGYNDNTYFRGMIAEVFVYARALSAIERQQVEQYLLLRYPRPNNAPVVNAGADQSIFWPQSVNLSGNVTDDGVPGVPLTHTWSRISGPGTVSFSAPNSLATSAGFSAAGVYTLRLTSSDGLLSSSDDIVISVNPPDSTPPVLTNIRTLAVSARTASIGWDTNEPATSQVQYGLTTAYGTVTTLDPQLVTSHAVTLSNLQPGVTYHFSVLSRDGAGNLATSGNFQFQTPVAPTSPVQSGLVTRYDLSQPAGQYSNVNLLQYPNFASWIIWRNTSAVITPNAGMAPDGTQTADRIWLRVPDGLVFHPYLATAPSQTYTFSVYLRSESGPFQLRLTRDNTHCWCGSTTPILTLTEQWQRYSLTFTTGAVENASAVGFGYEEITPWNLPVAGNIQAWGAQLEPGSQATPYVPGGVAAQAVTDLTGRGNNGWLGNNAAAVFDSSDPIRKTSGMYWDGIARWVQAPHTADLDRTTSGSWVLLVKPEAGWAPWATFLSKVNGASTLAQYSISRNSTNQQLDFYNGNDNHPYRGGSIPLGVWSVLTVTLEGGVLTGYIDKTQVFRYTNVPALRSVPTASLRIGAFTNYPHYFRGDTAAVLLYNRALSAIEVEENCDFLKAGIVQP